MLTPKDDNADKTEFSQTEFPQTEFSQTEFPQTEIEQPGVQQTGFQQMVAAAADLCRKPLRHAVIGSTLEIDDCCLKLEVRNELGERLPGEDLELEIYRSSGALNLTVAWADQPERPLLWQGSHPVWMDGTTGQRCERPDDGMPLEAFCRRLRALLSGL